MVNIRLTRTGKKGRPSYRIVVMPRQSKTTGQYLDLLGVYQPLDNKTEINQELAIHWLNQGAQPSNRVARLLTQAGLVHPLINVKVFAPKATEPAAEAATPKPEVKAETEPETKSESETESETASPAVTEEVEAVEEATTEAKA
ncbi:MAG: small subunit ribosomal protein S16 [Candidatus Berkelbacteria bacterium Gr01-1014_85]|uniref:Small ribosomal subunit protein bS16 n=1 Tax=Candidatus Berkelbacteria bacterium Gr01-1014_85 TaxID=2017150 RepID=A0A554JB51_9BACT|nr:MAG: small subunit ribosomal protein S16 [Candidatus Berkelbacteria bacterium Gr01-1014_85]